MDSYELKKQALPARRHCAYCLKFKPHKLCSGCHRRAYCSIECQRENWKPLGKGQGHKDYCKIEHGQEDIDWEVKRVPGKGLRIFAKRCLPAMYKIMIDGTKSSYCDCLQCIADSVLDGEILPNPDSNGSSARRNNRISRCAYVNHSCSSNAAQNIVENTDSLIVYAMRDIEAGEEISRNYRCCDISIPLRDTFSQISIHHELSQSKADLASAGVTCPRDCVCNDLSHYLNLSRLRGLQEQFARLKETNPLEAFRVVDDIISMLSTLNTCLMAIQGVHLRAALIPRLDPNLKRLGLYHAKKVREIESILDPLSRNNSHN